MSDYTFKDVVRYGGLFLGLGLTYKGLEMAGFDSHVGRLIAGIVVGLGLGWVAEKAYTSNRGG